MNYDKDNKILILLASYSFPINVIPSFLTMKDIRVEIRVSCDEGDIFESDSSVSLSLERYVVSGSWTVDSFSFDLSVTKEDDTFLIEGAPKPPTVSVDSFVAAIQDGNNFLPEKMASVLSSNAGLDKYSRYRKQR